MLISWSLLNSLIKIPKDINPIILCDLLNERGLEAYILNDISAIYKKLLIGKVEKNYNIKEKNIYKVDVSTKYLNIIHNIRLNIDDVVIVIEADTYLPGQKKYFKKFNNNNININAKICTLYDLGLSADVNTYLINLTKDYNLIGSNLKKILNYSDIILNVYIPNNRSDLFSYLGLAREILSFIYNKSYINYKINGIKKLLPELYYILKPLPIFKPLIFYFNNLNNKIKINIVDNNICEYYNINLIYILKKKSLKSLKSFLLVSGISPHNNITDVINFLIIFLGQQIKIFDLDKIKKNKISKFLDIKIKISTKKEEIHNENKKIILEKNDIVTYYNENPIALSGIIIDDKYSVDNTSTNIAMEIAYFNKKNIINTINNHNLKEIASNKIRYEINSQYNFTICELIKNLVLSMTNGILIASKNILNYSMKKTKILINLLNVSEIIGIKEIKIVNILNSFSSLGFKIIELDKENIKIIVPDFRSDISTNYDIIEEILKIITISSVKEELFFYKNIFRKPNIFKVYYEQIKKARSYLIGCGFSEVINYSFGNIIKYQKYKSIYNVNNDFISIKNPLTKNSVMRKSLIPDMLDNAINIIKKNINDNELKIFEYGRVFPELNPIGINYNYNILNVDDIEKDSPIKEMVLFSGILVSEKNKNGKHENILRSNFLYIKGILQGLLEYLGFSISFLNNQLECIKSNKSNYINKKEELTLFINIKNVDNLLSTKYEIGYMGRTNFSVKQEYEVILYEINFSLLFDILKNNNLFLKKINYEISQFPSIKRDISIIISQKLSVNKIIELIKNLQCCKNILKNIKIFDIFIGKNIDEEKKSMSISLEFRSYLKTLTNDEISKIMKIIFFEIKSNFSVKIRDGEF